MSNLIRHAEYEMKKVELDKKDSDYGGMLYIAVMELVTVLSKQGHSGFSHSLVMDIFNRVANFKTLSPLTDDPEEWNDVSDMGSDKDKKFWQSKREPSCFSYDNGKTYYSVDDENREVKKSGRSKIT